MMRDEHDYDLSRDLGARAIGYLKELKTPPVPNSYALLYHHAAGYDQALSSTVADLVRTRARLPHHDADRLYEAFLSTSKHIDPLTRSLSASATEIAETIESVEKATASFCASLQGMDVNLASSQGPEEATTLIRDLLLASNTIARQNRELEQELANSMQTVNELKRRIAAVKAEYESDPLTRLPARKPFRHSVAKALERARREAEPLCLLIVDIDEFGSYNEVHGRTIGDKVLRLVTDLIRAKLGGRHMMARYAGDQFAVLLANTTLEIAVRLAEELRNSVLGMKFVRKGSGRSVGRITVSAGVALLGYGDTAEALIERALEALATAKRLGRNRVRSAANANAAPSKA